MVFERDARVGGIAQTGSFRGYRFDIGGHRFFTKVDFVHDLWVEILGEDFLERPRLSRIYYDGKYFDYPLKPLNALFGLGLVESLRIGISYLRARAFPEPEERNFEQWITNRFGRRLFEIFFQSYTEKVWGIPCSQIRADWAAQRIKQLDLVSAVKNAVLGARKGPVIDSLIERFHYPRLGPGMMWTRCAEILANRGYATHLETEVRQIHHVDSRITGVTVRDASGRGPLRRCDGLHLVDADPGARERARACARLRKCSRRPTTSAIATSSRFSSSSTRPPSSPTTGSTSTAPRCVSGASRTSRTGVPRWSPSRRRRRSGSSTSCQQGDSIWSMPDQELIQFALEECARIGIVDPAKFIDGAVVRVPKAYPTYDDKYPRALERIRAYLDTFENLQLVGRNGQHRYNNQDHSMVTAIYAAQNLVGAKHEIWNVNVDDQYHEQKQQPEIRDRATPSLVQTKSVEELVRAAFARYDPVALAGSLALTMGSGLFLATAILLLQGGDPVGPKLSAARELSAGIRGQLERSASRIRPGSRARSPVRRRARGTPEPGHRAPREAIPLPGRDRRRARERRRERALMRPSRRRMRSSQLLRSAIARLRTSVMAVVFGLSGGTLLALATAWLADPGGRPRRTAPGPAQQLLPRLHGHLARCGDRLLLWPRDRRRARLGDRVALQPDRRFPRPQLSDAAAGRHLSARSA